MNIKKFISELKRRNVFRVATAYAIAGWLIIQVVTSVEEPLSLPGWFDTSIIVLVALGLPIALIIAWAFELTPEGLKKTREVKADQSITDSTGKKINRITIGVLSAAVLFLVVERVFFAESTFMAGSDLKIEEASIAVLPFVNMSGDEENEYFSDGLSEELLNGLAKLENIQVAGRTSSFQFKGTNPDLRYVGNQLGVHHILEGSVRKAGNRIRITAQLIQADNGFHLWSETYDRELTAAGIFDIQEEITRRVVGELKVRLLPEEEMVLDERPTQDIEAYNAFLEATQREITRQPEDIEYAISKYREAVRIDPTFSLAYGRLAYAYTLQYLYGDIPFEEAKMQVRRNIDQALTLNGNEGKAYQAMSSYYRNFEIDYEQAEIAAERAVELLPNDAMAVNATFLAYGASQKPEKREAAIYKAYELDPLNPIISSNYANILAQNEKYEEALEVLDKTIARHPDYSIGLASKANIIAGLSYGQIDEGFILAYKAYEYDRRDRNLITSLISLSYDLQLNGLASRLQEELAAYYPNNQEVKFWKVLSALFGEDYDLAEQELELYLGQFGEERRDDFHSLLGIIYYNQGKLDKAISILEKYNPDFTEENPALDEFNIYQAQMYLKFREESGLADQHEEFESLICTYFDEQAVKNREEGKIIDAYYDEVGCDVITGNKEAVIEAFEQLHFKYKNKRGWPQMHVFQGFLFDDMAGDPDFRKTMDDIYSDLHNMRANVVSYLKAEGEWQEEWEEEL